MVGKLKDFVQSMTGSSSASKHDKVEISETANYNNKMNEDVTLDICF